MFNSIEERVRCLELAAEAQRLIGLYSNYLSMGEFEKIPELFAIDAEDLYAEMLWGRYEGRDSISRLYTQVYPSLRSAGERKVTEALQAMEVPIISPAADCLTVKAVWICPGYYTVQDESGAMTGHWSWQRCGCDFIVTDSGLKIWHLHIYGLFETAYLSDDLSESGAYGADAALLPAELAPDAPPTTSFHLSPDSIYPYAPEIPKPYTVFDMDRAY